MLDSVRLMVTELITNSVRHAGASGVELLVKMEPKRVRVEVANPGMPFDAEPRAEDADDESDAGWGLFLVDRLSEDWGVLDDGRLQRVWFEIERA